MDTGQLEQRWAADNCCGQKGTQVAISPAPDPRAILWNLALPILKPVLQTSFPAEDHAYRTLAFSMWHPQCPTQAWTQSWNSVKEHLTNNGEKSVPGLAESVIWK